MQLLKNQPFRPTLAPCCSKTRHLYRVGFGPVADFNFDQLLTKNEEN